MPTDYDALAARYDANPHRVAAADPALEALPAGAAILDLACGTGTWLAAQHSQLILFGVDRSAGMLAVAARKVPRALFVRGDAAAPPFRDASFAHVACRYAWHHFEDKPRVAREIARVLASGGSFQHENPAPELSPDWWIYRFFPSVRAKDAAKFATVRQVVESLEHAGLTVAEPVLRSTGTESLATLRAIARNRETSPLADLDDASYAEGIARMEAACEDVVDVGLVIAEIAAVKG